jgi:hypothetical protein
VLSPRGAWVAAWTVDSEGTRTATLIHTSDGTQRRLNRVLDELNFSPDEPYLIGRDAEGWWIYTIAQDGFGRLCGPKAAQPVWVP